MRRDFFTILSPEITIDILSKLPIPTIVRCKCVCKSWHYLLETHEFVTTHLSNSVPGLVFGDWESHLFIISEFKDGLDLEKHEHHYIPVTKFDVNGYEFIGGSANGLLFFQTHLFRPDLLFICNPITREKVELDYPEEFPRNSEYRRDLAFGFGVSRMSDQHKVVGIFQNQIDEKTIPKIKCCVYTLGTGSWRNVKHDVPFEYRHGFIGAIFLNGNLHWLVRYLDGSIRISCFDLEAEVFSTFSTPSLPRHGKHLPGLSALRDCLCLCDNSSNDETVIWLMKEYGDKKSWGKEFVLKKDLDIRGRFYTKKIFKDGDILIAREYFNPVYYSNKSKTFKETYKSEMPCFGFYSMNPILHKSSFLSLKKFARENVTSF